MVLLCTKILQERISSDPDSAEELSSLVCYGCQFGLTYPVKLLKLKVDFEEGAMSFRQLFYSPPSPAAGALMDLLLEYTFQALKSAPRASP